VIHSGAPYLACHSLRVRNPRRLTDFLCSRSCLLLAHWSYSLNRLPLLSVHLLSATDSTSNLAEARGAGECSSRQLRDIAEDSGRVRQRPTLAEGWIGAKAPLHTFFTPSSSLFYTPPLWLSAWSRVNTRALHSRAGNSPQLHGLPRFVPNPNGPLIRSVLR